MTDIRKFAVGDLVMIKPEVGQRLRLTQSQLLAPIISIKAKSQYQYLCLDTGDGSKVFVPSFDVAKAVH